MTCCAHAFSIARKFVSALQVSGYSDALTYMREAGGPTRVNGDQIEESVNNSLARLGTDYIDLLQVRPLPPSQPESETWGSQNPVLFCSFACFLTLRPCWPKSSVCQCHAALIRLDHTVPHRVDRCGFQGINRLSPSSGSGLMMWLTG